MSFILLRKFSTINSTLEISSAYINVIFNRQYRRVVITGLGLISPLGINCSESWKNLIESKSGIQKVKNEEQFKDIPCKIAGYIPGIDQHLESSFNKNQLRTYSRSSLYGLLAAKEAFNDSGWNGPIDDNEAKRCGVTIGTGMINFDDIIEANDKLKQNSSRVSPHFITKILLNMPAGYVSIERGFRGPNHTVSTACTTGAHAIGDAFNFIRMNYADIMISGGVESAINPLSFASFCRIRALCTKFNDQPELASRPFDKDRQGFVMGESGSVVFLEELEHAKKRNARIYGELIGYGLSADAHHVTAPSEDGRGAQDSMNSALLNAQIKPEQVGHINCHATSTPLGDLIELNAIKEIFQSSKSSSFSITATKGSTGHLLGAAGAAETIFTLLSCYHGIIPPTLNLDNSIDPDMNIVGNKCQKWTSKTRIALTNSFGFGGTNATLVIKNYE